jgi:NAD(P)-dependent dehydrogenase (short-subunit alcohol dehydrogenase family)
MKMNQWNESNIPDITGKTAVVTGSSSGIGFETARVLAARGAHVILAVRNMEKGNAAAVKMRSRFPQSDVVVMALDLASLASVRAFAAAMHEKYSRLDFLINNAGVMIPPYSKTADGFELQFGTNHLGHFALTGLLMDLLQSAPKARIVNVSSFMHKSGNIDFNDLAWEKRKYQQWKAYGDSKIANLYFTYHLHKKLTAAGSTVSVTCAHPGWTNTDLQRHVPYQEFFNRLFAQTVEMGALPTLFAALGPNTAGGEFFGPSGFLEIRGYPKRTTSNPLSHDAAIAERLWNVSAQLTGVTFGI